MELHVKQSSNDDIRILLPSQIWKIIVWITVIFSSMDLAAQDTLTGASSTATDVVSGGSSNFTDLFNVSLDVSGVSKVMVVASFETRYGGAVSVRDAILKLSDGTDESETIRRTLIKSGGDDKGIGTLAYIFDASTLNGVQTYSLKHSSSKSQSIVSSGTMVALSLTGSPSGVDLSNDMKTISTAVPTSGNLNEWAVVTGLSTSGISLPSYGSVYVCASVNTIGDQGSIGEWKLQYSPDNSNWNDMGYTASRSVSGNNIYGISSLVFTLKNLEAGTYYFRLAHRQTSGNPGDIQTLNTTLVATALVFEDLPGSFSEFPSFNLTDAQESTTSTALTPIQSISLSPSVPTDMFVQAQYVIEASGESDSPAYDLSINNGILDGTDQRRYISSDTDIGSGGSVGLGEDLLAGTSYTLSLRHSSSSGITLTTKNSILTGFQLSSVSTSVWEGNGVSPNDWHSSDNWSGGSPGNNDNVYIPGGLFDYPILNSSTACQDLFMETGSSLSVGPASNFDIYGNLTNQGSLTVKADASNTGSLILHGSASGQVSSENYITADQWHIVSPPVSGQDFSTFLQDASNQIAESTSLGLYGLTDYDEADNSWNPYFTSATAGEFLFGRGYLLRREETDGTVAYSGNLANSDQSLEITRNGSGWNAVGNPFTSAIGITENANSVQNFLSQNLSQLDPNYAALYLWEEQPGYNGTQNNYKVIGNSGYLDDLNYPSLNMDYLQSGQGFLVKSASGGGSLSFTREMQTHQNSTATLKSARKSWDGFKLVVSKNGKTVSTVVCFHLGMTLGLDPSYDVGLLSSRPGFAVSTRLLSDDEGVRFKVQCLPLLGPSSLEIPVGLEITEDPEGYDATAYEFFTEGVFLQADQMILLEDRWKDTLVNMTLEGEVYSVRLDSGNSGPDRFFLHVKSSSSATGNNTESWRQEPSASFQRPCIFIRGMDSQASSASLFDMQGRMIESFTLQGNTTESLAVPTLESGIYFLRLNGGPMTKVFKLLID